MIELGSNVKDSITGFAGVATARTVYLNGCVQIGVTATGLTDGKIIEDQWIDEGRLGPSEAKAGGPGPRPPGLPTPS